MSKMTITEALAEMKTVSKRLEKKRGFVMDYLMRPEQVRDPLQRDGGTATVLARERQAIRDLCERTVAIRRAIQSANENTTIVVGNQSRSIADWLVWRREVAPWNQKHFADMRAAIDKIRQDVLRRGAALSSAVDAAKPGDVIVNVDEQELAAEIENLETVLGTLDGQLSLKNATVVVDV